MNTKTLWIAGIACVLSLGLGACEKKGTFEKAGEEVDEAAHTLKNGGKETTADKLDDAADSVREGVSDAAKDVKDAAKDK
ncbi:MAG TPA: hypothetical protein VGN07_11425 [Steroidobacteraceae bacterium]|jgi:hypothetical protein